MNKGRKKEVKSQKLINLMVNSIAMVISSWKHHRDSVPDTQVHKNGKG